MKLVNKIVQLDINDGSLFGDGFTHDVIKNILIPSVVDYANKYKYDYEIIRKSVFTEYLGPLDFFKKKSEHYSFERYLRIRNQFSNVIYIDTDVYISKTASPIPEITGIMAAKAPGILNHHKSFNKAHKLGDDAPHFNAGVIMTTNHLANGLSEYMINRYSNRIQSPAGERHNNDNSFLNEYFLENPDSVNMLDEEWNYMPTLPGSKEGLKCNFLHFVGIDGKRLLKKLSHLRVSLEENISKIAEGKILLTRKNEH